MHLLKIVNRCCYAAALVSVIVGAFLAIFAIWTESQDVAWKGVTTTVVVLFASVLVMVINGVLGVRVVSDDVEWVGFSNGAGAGRAPRGRPVAPAENPRDPVGPGGPGGQRARVPEAEAPE